MQLSHSHRQLLSRCSLRWYSVPASNSSDATAASGTLVPSRLKRPFASSFGGIDIQNVAVPTQSASNGFRNKIIRPSQPRGFNDQSPDGRHMGQPDRNRGMGRDGASSVSGWGDGLVSLSFSSRLKLRQERLSNTRGTDAGPHSQEEGQSWKQKSNQAQRPQMNGHRRGQGYDASQTHHRRGKTEESASAAAAAQRGNRAFAPITDAKNNKSKTSSMTRPSSSSTFKPTTTATPKAASASSPSSSHATATQPTTSDRKARLAVLSSTNLNALFRTNTTPTAGVPLPSLPSSTTTASALVRDRVRSVLEHSAGDYSRYVGVGERNALRLPALRKARLAFATQRDVSLEQRRVALHIIEGLVQPRREVRA